MSDLVTKNKTDLNSTEKVLKLLTAFLPQNEPRGTLEIAKALGIHRASVSRILGILKKNGFVQQDEKTRLYSLGPVVAALGTSLKQSLLMRFESIVQPYLHQLSAKVRESVGFVVLADLNVRVTHRVKGPQPVSVIFEHGEGGAINANAGAKSILAFYSRDRLDEVINAHIKLPSYTPNTITKWADLKRQFKDIRKTGIAYDLEEYNKDVLAIGAPIFDLDDEPIAAITILVPSLRAELIHDPKTAGLLKEATSEVSSQMMNSSHAQRDFASL